jgi:hypothetical protein
MQNVFDPSGPAWNSQFTLATSPAVVIVVSFAIGNVMGVTANKSPENRLNIRRKVDISAPFGQITKAIRNI